MAEENAWQTYADQVRNKIDYDTNQWIKTEVCSGAAIYGHDGSLWASSGDEGHDLTTYQHPQEQMDGSTKNIEVNEVYCAMKACEGNRSPSDAGIRMGNQKYMLKFFDDAGVCNLTRSLGGASVGKTATAVVIGFWKKDGKDSEGKF